MERLAIDVALDMIGRPFLIRAVQRSPLPDGVREVMRLATCSEVELGEASKARGRDPRTLRQAAIFFLQQALLCPGADSYRILGLFPGATPEEIHDHRRLLLKWLHPDRNPSRWEQTLFQRVTDAAVDLEQRSGGQSTRSSAIPTSPRHVRSRRNHVVVAKHKKSIQGRARLLAYIRRIALISFFLILAAGVWRLLTGEPTGSTRTAVELLPW